jgi:hydrogenase small subunit
MASEGETALENMYKIAEEYKGKFSLVVEGAVPRAADGRYCIIGEVMDEHGHHKEITMLDCVKELGAKSGSVLCVGTCSAFGGIPAAEGNETDPVSVQAILDDAGIKKPLVNVPGCPPHPDWIVGTVAHLLTQGVPELDGDNRPTMFFGESLHENCPYAGDYDEDKYVATFTDKSACRAEIGCKGPSVSSDCYKRHWNGDVNWCINNAVCIGCVESGFPDAMSPLYEAE